MSVYLSWVPNMEPDISGYEIYRSTSEDGSYTKIADTNGDTNFYNDEDGTVGLWYKVRAYNNRDVMGEFSPVAEAIGPVACRVYGHVTDASGVVVESANIHAIVQPRQLILTDTNVVIGDEVMASSDSNGWWQMFLYPNNLLTPPDSTYIFEISSENGYEYTKEVIIPNVSEILFNEL